MKIASYNTDSCTGMDEQCDPERTIRLLEEIRADVIGIQEVSIGRHHRGPAPGVRFPDMAAARLKGNCFFGQSLAIPGDGIYGNAVLSRYGIEPQEVLPLKGLPPEAEPRSASIVRILAPKPFYFIVTHLPFQGEFPGDDDAREQCLRQIQERVLEKQYLPAVMTGDMNARPDSPAIRFLRQNWAIANDAGDYPPTACAAHCGWCHIDYIACFPKDAFAFRSFAVHPDRIASDHHPVVAEFQE